jgi:hypothetical protein
MMSTTAAIVIAGEVGKALLGIYFEYMKQQGMTAEQVEQLYQDTKAAFNARDPNTIPNV